jgi:predicted O-methyltransferase YrrM
MKDFRRGEPNGWCCGDTKDMLKSVINDINPENIAEIGSFKGMSAYYMCKNSDAHIYCIDHWKGSPEHKTMGINTDYLYETFIDNMEDYIDRITPIRKSSHMGLRELKKLCDVDMIFIDGDHSYTGATHDISLAIELFPNAVICGDDYTLGGVRKAVDTMAKHYGLQVKTFKDRAWRLK